MKPTKLREALQRAAPVGAVLKNPGGGTSKIVGYNDLKLSYRRGSSTIYLAYSDIVDVLEAFRGREVASSDLKAFNPHVFDSTARPAGHSCNCTMLFMLLEMLGKAGPLGGSGVRGDPFTTKFSR